MKFIKKLISSFVLILFMPLVILWTTIIAISHIWGVKENEVERISTYLALKIDLIADWGKNEDT